MSGSSNFSLCWNTSNGVVVVVAVREDKRRQETRREQERLQYRINLNGGYLVAVRVSGRLGLG